MAEDRVSQPLSADPQWTPWHTFVLLLIIAIMALTGLLFPSRARLGSWMITLVLLGTFAAVAGQGITGLWRGLLIDERNKISLARLQLTLWTIVVLSGFLTAALSNLAERTLAAHGHQHHLAGGVAAHREHQAEYAGQ
jgi:hypothetical protein